MLIQAFDFKQRQFEMLEFWWQGIMSAKTRRRKDAKNSELHTASLRLGDIALAFPCLFNGKASGEGDGE